MRCEATSKQAKRQCQRHATPGKRVCAIHGGKTPSGPAAGSYKHGRYSKAIKDLGLRQTYERARTDPKLTDLREEIAFVETRLQELIGAEAGTTDIETELDLIEQRRKLVESLHKLEHRPELSVPIEQVFGFIRQVYALFVDIVPDRQQQGQFVEGMRQLVGRTRDLDVIATTASE